MNGSDRLAELVMSQEQRAAFLERMRVRVDPGDYRRIETFCQVVATLGQDNLSKLRHLMFGRKTESTDQVCSGVAPAPPAAPKPPPKGHGRCAARRYTGARWIQVSHHAESVGVTVAVLRYGSGLPDYRLARLQQSLGVPLPESTQWELLTPLFQLALPIFEELLRQTAQSPLLHNDDTAMRILDLRRPGSATLAELDPERKGTFTTGLVGSVGGHPVALFMTGWRHAGENLARILEQRATELPPPIQMCDALSRNTCGQLDSVLANCLSHGRREFVPLATSFPDEVRFVLEAIREVYRAEAQSQQLGLRAQDRLLHHQTHSKPVMDKLPQWMSQQLEEKKVEPNSGLGQAMGYLLRHWEPLTLFLRQAGGAAGQ